MLELSTRESFLNVFELFFTLNLCVDCAPNISVHVVKREKVTVLNVAVQCV